VQAFGFVSAGECNDFLARALRDLVQHEPLASVALIARHPEQARLYFEALAAAEVPDCVWWLTRIFCSGRDRCHRRGADQRLEFDIVILLEVTEGSYPNSDIARRMLHVAMTRAAHQLWITHTGRARRFCRGLALSLQASALEEAIERPHLAGAQALEANTHAGSCSTPPGSTQRTSPPTSIGSDCVGMRNRICSLVCKGSGVVVSTNTPPSEMFRVVATCRSHRRRPPPPAARVSGIGSSKMLRQVMPRCRDGNTMRNRSEFRIYRKRLSRASSPEPTRLRPSTEQF